MVGTDIDALAVAAAQENIQMTTGLSDKVRIRQQLDRANIFEGVLLADEYYHFTICNPPFHPSREAATKGTLRKVGNLHRSTVPELNFGGSANELWCNGGEALFIKRMIKQSRSFGKQVGWFTTLVSKKENLPKIYTQLKKLKASYNTIPMEQGHKKTRFVAWKFS
jgi:23S rRNA (adenine1618-N6)-methyltransferase